MSEKRCVSTEAPLMVLTQDASPLLILFCKVIGYRVLLFHMDRVNLKKSGLADGDHFKRWWLETGSGSRLKN